jgi:hypothetical protein
MKWLLAGLTAMGLALTPGLAFAQDGQDEDVLIRIGADARIAVGERAGTVIVIDGNALIEGEVADAVLVINGNAVVAGEVSGQITVIAGDIELQATAQVKDVTSIRGNILRSEGSTITGEVHERDGFGWLSGAAVFFSIAFWLGLTVALIGAGLIFAAIGGRQLREAARRMTAEPVNTVLGVVFVAVAIPVLAGFAIATLVGILFGVGLLVFLLPALWFLGYIVAAARLGGALIGLRGPDAGGHPYAATVLGVVLLQLLVLVPVIGAVVAVLAGLWGAGALAVGGYKAAGGRGVESSPGSDPAITTVQQTAS